MRSFIFKYYFQLLHHQSSSFTIIRLLFQLSWKFHWFCQTSPLMFPPCLCVSIKKSCRKLYPQAIVKNLKFKNDSLSNRFIDIKSSPSEIKNPFLPVRGLNISRSWTSCRKGFSFRVQHANLIWKLENRNCFVSLINCPHLPPTTFYYFSRKTSTDMLLKLTYYLEVMTRQCGLLKSKLNELSVDCNHQSSLQ